MNLDRTETSLNSLTSSSPSSKRIRPSGKLAEWANLLPRRVIQEFVKVLMDDLISKASDSAEVHEFTMQTFQYHFEGAGAISHLVAQSPTVLNIPDMLDIEPMALAFENWNRNSVLVMQKPLKKVSISSQDISILSMTQKGKGRGTNTSRNSNQLSNSSLKRAVKDNFNEQLSLYSKSRRDSFSRLAFSKENNPLPNNRKQPSVIRLLPAQSSLSLNGRLNEEDLRTKKTGELLERQNRESKISVKLADQFIKAQNSVKERLETFQIKRDVFTFTTNGEPFVIKPSKNDNIKSLIQHPK